MRLYRLFKRAAFTYNHCGLEHIKLLAFVKDKWDEPVCNGCDEITHIANLNRISNLVVTHHFYAPVYLSVLMTILF